jgi:hypothetical protein
VTNCIYGIYNTLVDVSLEFQRVFKFYQNSCPGARSGYVNIFVSFCRNMSALFVQVKF